MTNRLKSVRSGETWHCRDTQSGPTVRNRVLQIKELICLAVLFGLGLVDPPNVAGQMNRYVASESGACEESGKGPKRGKLEMLFGFELPVARRHPSEELSSFLLTRSRSDSLGSEIFTEEFFHVGVRLRTSPVGVWGRACVWPAFYFAGSREGEWARVTSWGPFALGASFGLGRDHYLALGAGFSVFHFLGPDASWTTFRTKRVTEYSPVFELNACRLGVCYGYRATLLSGMNRVRLGRSKQTMHEFYIGSWR